MAKGKKKNKYGRKKVKGKNTHHILPRSKGGKIFENTIDIDIDLHARYHMLFVNKTPEEIIQFLFGKLGFRKYFSKRPSDLNFLMKEVMK